MTERSSFDSHWKELADFLLPRRSRFWTGDRNRGDKRNQNIINSTGRYSARTLASGLHAGLTSPARPWMKLTTPDPDLADYGPVKEWLHIVTQRMLNVFAQTNLYNVLPIVYGDLGVFGTASMSILEDSKDLFRCYAYPIGSYAFGQDARGLVTTFVREYELTVRQVVTQFGVKPGSTDIDWSNISEWVKDLWRRGNFEESVSILWVVQPNEEADPTKLEAKYLPWSSCHYEWGSSTTGGMQPSDAAVTEGRLLRESGFRAFPIMGPRWDITAEDTYGTDCPGMTALGDIRQLQIMERRKGQAIAKMIDPPLVGPSSLRTQKTSLLPGDITYVDVREGQQGLKSIHDVTLRLTDLVMDIRGVEYRIQRAFYEDLFLMLARSDDQRGMQPPTAREIDERHEEKLIALGPVLERTNDELLDPIVDRVYGLMDRAGLIPDAPDALNGVDLKVEYISILAQAQKLVGVVGQDRFVQSVLAMAPVLPGVLDKVNTNQVIDNYADMLGVDPRIVRTNDEADKIADDRAQQQKGMIAAEQAKNLLPAVAAAGKAPIADGSALDNLRSSIAAAGGGGGA